MPRRVQQAPPPLKMRISKGHGWFMIVVGLFFDFLPLFMIIAVMVFGYAMAGAVLSKAPGKSAQERADYFCGIVSSGVGNKYELKNAPRLCDRYTQAATSQSSFVIGFAVTAGIGGGALLAPILYIIGSYAAVFFGYIFFTIWFFIKHVNIWSLTKPKRIIMSALTMLMEGIPVLNLLPGITFMVWRHVKMTQVEDKLKHSELVKKQMRVIQGGGRRVPRYMRAA